MQDYFDQQKYLELLKQEKPEEAKTYLEGSPGYMGNREFDTGPKIGETKVENGVTFTFNGTSWDPVETGGGGDDDGEETGKTLDIQSLIDQAVRAATAGTSSSSSSSSSSTASNEPIVGSIQEIDGVRHYWGGTARGWQPIGQAGEQTTRPSTAIPGADANMSTDKYVESLGLNTLAGQAFQESLARRLASLDEQQFAAGQSYQDMYEQAKMSQAARRGLSDVSGMTAGMAEGRAAQLSAAEMGSLSQIGISREGAMRALETARLGAPMEAFGEARAIDEYERAVDQYERAQQFEMVEFLRNQQLFEQAQAGWTQDPETGEWVNIAQEEAKAIQDQLTLQGANAQQRAEILAEIQYWQEVAADTANQSSEAIAEAKEILGTLQTRYASLLSNSSVITGTPSTTGTTPTINTGNGAPTPEPEPEPIVTKTTTEWASDVSQDLNVLLGGGEDVDQIVRKSQFKDSVADNVSDLSRLVISLGSENARNNPSYDYEYETDLVYRASTDPTSLTMDEVQKLERYTSSAGSFVPPSLLMTDGFRIPKTESTQAFVDYLDSLGIINFENVTEENPGAGFWNFMRTAKTGSVQAMDKYDTHYKFETFNSFNLPEELTIPKGTLGPKHVKDITIPTANTRSRDSKIVELYLLFLDDYNRNKLNPEG